MALVVLAWCFTGRDVQGDGAAYHCGVGADAMVVELVEKIVGFLTELVEMIAGFLTGIAIEKIVGLVADVRLPAPWLQTALATLYACSKRVDATSELRRFPVLTLRVASAWVGGSPSCLRSAGVASVALRFLRGPNSRCTSATLTPRC